MDKEANNDMTWPKGHKPKEGSTENLAIRFGLISNILKEKPVKKINTEIFNVMATRRSTRKFSKNPVEMWKIDKILAAADTAPAERTGRTLRRRCSHRAACAPQCLRLHTR